VDTQEQFYAYRSHGDACFYPVTMRTDTGTGDPVHPAGEVMCFATKEERDAYVNRGQVATTDKNGHDLRLHAVHTISEAKASEVAKLCASSTGCVHRYYASKGRLRMPKGPTPGMLEDTENYPGRPTKERDLKVAAMNGHTYDGKSMVCPDIGPMRYCGHHQFSCQHGVFDVSGGRNPKHPAIMRFLDNDELASRSLIAKQRSWDMMVKKAGTDRVEKMFGPRPTG
jgi:hypothetical protein